MAWKAKEYQIGDRHPDIAAAKAQLQKIAAKLVGTRLLGDGGADLFSPAFAEVLAEWKAIVTRDVASGRRPGPALPPSTVIDWGTKVQLGLIPRGPVTPPPPPVVPRHAALVFRGTGGVIDHDYVYFVAREAGLEIIYLDFPASMGGLPPGAAGQPSAEEAIAIGYRSAASWIKGHPQRTFELFGYSLGEIVIARLLEALFTPGGELYPFRSNYVASVHIGPPARPLGGGFYGGTAAPGVGIASKRLPAAIYAELGPRACYLCHPDDMYGAIPVPVDGGTGDIMETVYDMVTATEISDPLGTLKAMIPHLLEIVTDAGVLPGGLLGSGSAGSNPLGGLGGLLGGGALLAGGPLALVPLVLPMLVSAMPGLIAGIGGGVGGSLTGPAAAAQAAILGMKFLVAGTRPHIEYHLREVWPGQTYLGLGIQHARHWATLVPVRT